MREGNERKEGGWDDDVIIVHDVGSSNRRETTVWVRCTCSPLLWSPPSR